MTEILKIENITKEFPGVKALSNVSFRINKGEAHGLVGENGAGKSTLMKILSGVYPPTKGSIHIDNKKVALKGPKHAQEIGISIIHQEFSLIPYLNAIDNIFLGKELRKTNGLLDKASMKRKTEEALQKLNANIDITKPVIKLSIADQQFIEIAKAILVDCKILIFDEPTASLTGKEVGNLFNLIENLKNQGITIIYISHHLEEITTLCDNITCLRDGEWVGSKSIKETDKDDMIKMMVGREISNTFPKKNHDTINNENVLEVKDLQNNSVTNISFSIKKGEVLGIAGLVGSGRTETIRALIGADKVDKKEIHLHGEKVDINSPTDALKYGICLIPEDRKTQGLILDFSVGNNISLPVIHTLRSTMKFIDRRKEKDLITKSIKSLLIKTPSSKQKAKLLSGGNQQKIVLAKWLNTECDLIIFDEPTRGIDVGAKEEIYKLIRSLTEKGISIIIISSELPEVLGLSDRIMVMHDGGMKAELSAEEATSEKVMSIATGGENA